MVNSTPFYKDGTWWAKMIVTVVTAGIAVWWLIEVSYRIGEAPMKDGAGNITVDTYQRAKDVLVLVLPLFSAAIGYWLGSVGKEKADAGKENAEAAAAKKAQALDAVLGVSNDEELLQRARDTFPDAFN